VRAPRARRPARGERETIELALRSVESANRQFADRYLEVEEENNNFANLYVASYQLHSTLNPSEVLKVIVEIVINLIGAEVFCIYLAHPEQGMLEPIASEGAPLSHFPQVAVGSGWVGQSVADGEVATRIAPGGSRGPIGGGEPIVSIPLRVEEREIGAIVIYSLMPQKPGFSELDQELFSLLAGHAVTAIFASQLYARSERKLSTVQGFIDLLTS
jgi:GAF domain-containing protein